MKRLQAAGRDLAPLSQFKLGILAGSTFDLVLDCLPAAAARHGVALSLVSTPYDQVMQHALDPDSEINRAAPDAVLVAVDHRWLNLDQPRLAAGSDKQVAGAMQRLKAVVDGLQTHARTPAILQTLPCPSLSLFGNYDRRLHGTVRMMIDEANRQIVALANETNSYLLDVAALAEGVGTYYWFDPVQWMSYKLPFAAEFFPCFAEMLGRLLGSIRGKARKCLVLDLDNTIWGGVIGDDGIDGIKIGQGSALGEAFLAVQQAALAFRERGVILAVCSKNNDDVARNPFRGHPEMLLKENHIAVFQANWIDKPTNLEAIAKTLNIGVDSLVLLDDNPAERAQVRAALPVVAVPELPEDPCWYPWYLSSAGYFEAVTYSSEDSLRASSYEAEAQRAATLATARDLGDYLTSLEMVLTFQPFDRQGRQRITQLINKTNQFNLTTRRYTEVEVAAMEEDASILTLQVRLKDRFSDMGMIGVIVARPAGENHATWEIDTWLMSCRVLGRKVEEAMLGKIVREAAAHGVRRLVGLYIPTAKNGMVSDHYAKLGFTLVDESARQRRFELMIAETLQPDLPFHICETAPQRADGGGQLEQVDNLAISGA